MRPGSRPPGGSKGYYRLCEHQLQSMLSPLTTSRDDARSCRNECVSSFSKRHVHYMEANVSVCWMTKCLRHRGKDLKAEGAPQPNRRRIGFDNRIELHRPVSVRACLFKDTPAQSSARALTAPRGMDDKAGIGNVRPRARMNGMSVRASDDTSIIIHGDNGAPWQPGLRRVPDLPSFVQYARWAVFGQVVDAGMPRDHVGLRGLRERGAACPQWHCRAWVRACITVAVSQKATIWMLQGAG